MASTRAPSAVSRDLGRVEGQLGLVTKLAGAIIAILVVIIGGGFALYKELGGVNTELGKEIGEVKSNLGLLEKDLRALDARVQAIDQNVNNLSAARLAAQNRIEATLGRIEQRVSSSRPSPPLPVREPDDVLASLVLPLSREEMQIIRTVLNPPPPKPNAKAKFGVGDVVPASALKNLPDQLIKDLPKLAGARFTIDQDSSIVIVAGRNNKVVAVVPAA